MNTFKKVVIAITGYAGSTERPDKTALRLYGVIIGVVAQLMPIILMAVSALVDLPEGVTAQMFVDAFNPTIQAIMYVVAGLMWLVGMVRAGMTAIKTQNLGALYGAPKLPPQE